jgi:hypothetical protein
MKILASIVLAAATVATAAASTPSSVKVQGSNVSFKYALNACPGALAGISFSLHHVRIAEQAGVSSDLDDANPASQVLTLTGSTGSAVVTIDAQALTVSAKNVKLAGKTVACISPD